MLCILFIHTHIISPILFLVGSTNMYQLFCDTIDDYHIKVKVDDVPKNLVDP